MFYNIFAHPSVVDPRVEDAIVEVLGHDAHGWTGPEIREFIFGREYSTYLPINLPTYL